MFIWFIKNVVKIDIVLDLLSVLVFFLNGLN